MSRSSWTVRDMSIKAAISSHIASLVDPKLVKRDYGTSPELRARRNKAQADREEREANREAYE